MKPETQPIDNFLIVGLVRDCSNSIFKDVLGIQKVFERFSNVKWLLIESDSKDNSLKKLEDLTHKIDEFRFISCGNLQKKMSLRTERLAYCRNIYLNELHANENYKNIDFLVIADFDGINNILNETALLSCWDRNDWDVCTANQQGPYYDVWALRHPLWSPNDCWDQQKFFEKNGVTKYKSIEDSIYSRMININSSNSWIEVDSAFGGFAIYRRSILKGIAYNGLNEQGHEICEHVVLHRSIKLNGGKIFINPKLINANYTDHSKHMKCCRRLIIRIKLFISYVVNR